MTASRRARRVLVIAYDFPPHAAIGTMRTLRVVRQLHARGWHVTVLTGNPASYLPSTPVDPTLLAQVPAGVRVVRARAIRPWAWVQRVLLASLRGEQSTDATATAATSPRADAPPRHPSTRQRHPVIARLVRIKDRIDAALAIPDRESGWLLPALCAGVVDRLRHGRPDVIYSSAPPWTGQLVAAGLQRVVRRPWVADFRDPWARAPWRGDRYPFALRAAARLERRVVRRADRIVFVAAANRDDFIGTYGPAFAARSDVVPNGCDPAEIEGLRHVHPPADGPHVMLHAGSLYAGRTPVPLFHAIARALADGALDRQRFRLRFLGASALTGVDLPGTCRTLGIEDVVEFHPRVPRAESLRAMLSASSLLLLQPGHTVSVPGKVYEYIATGRPILAIAEEGETAHVVRESGNGVSIAPDDPDAIVQALVTTVRHATRAGTVPPRHLFDGHLRAAQIAGILEAVTAGDASPANALAGTRVES